MRFRDTLVVVADRYSLGVEEESGAHYLSIPVSNRLVDYEEHYRLSADEYAGLSADARAAREFAEGCRRREHDERLILQPGCAALASA